MGLSTLATTWDSTPDQASEIRDRAYQLALKGVQLNPESAAAQSRLAMIRTARLDWIGGEQGFTRAIELLADRPIVGHLCQHVCYATVVRLTRKSNMLLPLPWSRWAGAPSRLSWHASLAQGRFAEAKEISNWQNAANRIENNLDIALNERDPEELKAAIQAMPKTNVAAIALYAPVLAEFDSPERILSIACGTFTWMRICNGQESFTTLQWWRRISAIRNSH